MSRIRPAKYKPSSSVERTGNDWPIQSPYPSGFQPKLGGPSVGRKVKVCPVNADNKTIFIPEWSHGDL